MYLEHFGLNYPPFRITPDTRSFFAGAERGAVLEALQYAIVNGEGIIKVVGEVGTGKTMLCRMLETTLPEPVHTIYIHNPSVSPENILNTIALEAELIDVPQDKLTVMRRLHAWLLDQYRLNKPVVLLIEEAQSMPLETLEEIRLLNNLETDEHKLLQIVLFGQPELDDKLNNPSIRQFRERITHHFYLHPLDVSSVQAYLNFRLRSAGYRGPDLFQAKLARKLGRGSRGLIRRINIMADKMLLAAYADGTTQLTPKHLQLAARDSEQGRVQILQWRWLLLGLSAGVALTLITVSLLLK
ncbi:MAG: AAA family ATPase [Gammaproteobacteria bacterium]|nr:AAA family ATPase [Gammaproteobacteria bacterium]